MKRKYKILLLDDDLMSLQSLQQFLNSEGHIVDAFDNVAEALKSGKRNRYDIVAADYSMPEMNGLDFLSKVMIYQSWATSILFTGYPTRELYSVVRKSNINLFFEKPIIIHKFMELIDQETGQKLIPHQNNTKFTEGL